MDTLVIGDVTYTKASVLAREYGYTADYLGQLCRAGKVTCILVGRTRYIDRTSIEVHRQDKYKTVRQSEITNKINLRIESSDESKFGKTEHVSAVLSKNTIKSFDSLAKRAAESNKISSGKIVYESDNYDLFPQGARKEVNNSIIRPIISIPVELGSASPVEVVSDNPDVLGLEFTTLPEVPLMGTLQVKEVPDFSPSETPELYVRAEPHVQAVAAPASAHFLKKISQEAPSRRNFTPQVVSERKVTSLKLVLTFCLLAALCSAAVVTVDSYTIASGAAVYTGLVFNPGPLLQFFSF